MATIDLNHLRVFSSVVSHNSFSLAAQELGVPRSTVSRAISALEEHVGAELFHRTTRKVTISEEGKALMDRTGPALATLQWALLDMPQKQEEPRGTLKVTSTADVGSIVLAEAVARFTARWPATNVKVVLSTRVIDLAREGFDLAVRVTAGRLADSALVARKVGNLSFQLYASPAYLARRGTPRASEELDSHDWISFTGVAPTPLGLALRKLGISTTPRIECDDMFFLREAIRRGGGIGLLPGFLADPGVTEGSIVRVLPRWSWSTGSAYIVQPQRKHIPARTTAFYNLLVELLRQNPL